MNEEIKAEIKKQIDNKFKSELSLLTLPLISQYKLLCFDGNATGAANLNPNFNINDLIGRTLIIKSIEIMAYYVNDSEDIRFSDGTIETIPATFRIERVFDQYDTTSTPTNNFALIINGQIWNGITTTRTQGNIPPNYKIDNIFYKYPEKIQTINCRYYSAILEGMTTPGTTRNPNVKIFIECYLI